MFGFGGGGNRNFVRGHKSIIKMLAKLRKSDAKKIANSAVLASIRVVRQVAKGRLPSGYKYLGRSIKTGARRNSGPNLSDSFRVGFSVGVNKSKQLGISKTTARGRGDGIGISARNVHWLILGTSQRRHRSGKNTGKMSIAPGFGHFMKRAFNASGAGMRRAMVKTAKTKIRQYLAKNRGRKG